jgi:hypothetical protein
MAACLGKFDLKFGDRSWREIEMKRAAVHRHSRTLRPHRVLLLKCIVRMNVLAA